MIPTQSKPTLVLPFVSDESSDNIKRLCSTLFPGEPFRVSFRSTSSVKELFRRNERISTRGGMKEEELELSGVVYKLTCLRGKDCNQYSSYVGETGRILKKRLGEHFSNSSPDDIKSKLNNISKVKLHALESHGSNSPEFWKVEVLARCPFTQKRKIVESTMIRDHKPNLNANEGLTLVI
jgi:hypothetical protein